jgi:hypothetical protein
LIRKALTAASQIFTVIFTVNLSGTSTGAGFRPVRPKPLAPTVLDRLETRVNTGFAAC